MIKRLLLAGALATSSALALAAAGPGTLLEASVDLNDKAALQNGARLFVNYCMGCHSLQYMRYKRMGDDLGLTEKQVADNLMFAADKVVDPMGAAMRSGDAERWFGVAPPDLSVIARSRGADWLYSYLVTFYRDDDPSRPFGVNNVVFPQVGMPHVLWALQGYQDYVPAEVDGKLVSESIDAVSAVGDEIIVAKTVTLDRDGEIQVEHVADMLKVSEPGSMRPGEFRRAMRDLVSFLVYVGEPAQLERYSIGLWTLLFLVVFFIVARLLYKEYWKDVH